MAGPQTEPPPAPWYFAGLLVFSTVLDFVCAHRIHAVEREFASDDDRTKARAKRVRNAWLGLSLLGNLGLLAYFKYVNFLIDAFADVGSVFGLDVTRYHLDVILPLGISFYTFQSLSYTLDVWRGRLQPERSFTRFALFVAFFPQLVAGPIVRASQFLPQLHRGPRFSRANLETGAFRIVRGLTKKVILGDWLAVQLTDRIFDAPETYTSPELMIALYAYTLQIYADFSGYSDMAIGLGRMLGFELPENFDRPYQSKDIAEYWRRWHMTLSSWLRDYLFFQLLARFGPRGGYLALWTTMFMVGMWHGASWNFVVYANLHALAMVFNRWNRTRKRDRSLPRRLLVWPLLMTGVGAFAAVVAHFALHLPWEEAAGVGAFFSVMFAVVSWVPLRGGKGLGVVHVFLTFHFVVLARIFFRAPDFGTARAFVAGLVDWDGHWIRDGLATPWVWAVLVLGLVYHFTPTKWVSEYACNAFRRIPGVLLGLGFVALSYGLMKLLEGAPRAFIYFQF
jgi:D-alanyl-lipoteichoic acid acyltransferase DltB (MBOAT superfamily)